MRQFRLIASTVALTILIWAAADQSLTDTGEVPIVLEMVPTGGTEGYVEIIEPSSHQAKVVVVGPRTVVDAVARKGPLPVRLSSPTEVLGRQRLNLVDQLTGFRDLFEGVTIESTDPETVLINVDRLIVRPIRVEINRGNLEFEESLRVEPESVEVTLRESHWSAIRDRDPHFVLNLQPIVAQSPEGSVDETLALGDTLLGYPVKTRPGSVVVRGRLLRRLETVTLNAVPILFVGTADLLNQFQIVPREELITRSVTLRGPKESLEWLKNSEQLFTGYIILTRSDTDVSGETRTVQPQFRLPPDVKLVEDPAPVEFELRPLKISQGDDSLG